MNQDESLLLLALFFALSCTSIFIIGISARFALFFWRRRVSSGGQTPLSKRVDMDSPVTQLTTTITDDEDEDDHITIELAEESFSD